jgi:esterase/lipase superfamily enzyme
MRLPFIWKCLVLLLVITVGCIGNAGCSSERRVSKDQTEPPSLPSTNSGQAEVPPPPPPPVATAPPNRSPASADGGGPDYGVVRVFYATDRKSQGTEKPGGFYGGERSESDLLSLGTFDVSIPRDHKMGNIERPSIWRLDFREDPEKHVVLLSVAPKPEPQFFNELSARVAGSTGKEALVFVHGFDTTFADAARRTAQLAYDLAFDGAPILYSWPSKGRIADYPADEATIEWTTPHLKQFLERIAADSHAATVHLIAHSMGNRALVGALSSIATEHAGTIPPMFKQVFLAAPDIDVGVFMQLAKTFPTSADHVTLYASSKDKALIASKKFHKDRRVGDAAAPIVVVPKVDTIDATAVDTGFLGHSYYGDNRSILTDIFYVIRKYDPPGKRFGMQPNKPQGSTYWLFRP